MCEQSHASVDQLLTALWHAEYHGRYNLYRTAIILLADVGLEFGMTKWCKRLLDEVMPQVGAVQRPRHTSLQPMLTTLCVYLTNPRPVISSIT